MKTLNIIPLIAIILVLLISQLLFANDDKYTEAMKKNIETLYDAKTLDEIQTVINSMERIGAAEKNRWEPSYYSAYGYIMIAMRETDVSKKDKYLDLSNSALKHAKSLLPNDSEVLTLEGFIYMIRVTVDPATRGQQFAPLSMQSFEKAIALNAENPRALALLSQMQFGTAQFFGSSTTEACNTVDQALAKFETYKSENPLAPRWGKRIAERVKQNCN